MNDESRGDALVVGASGGIGGAVVQRLVEEDYCTRVFAVSRSDRPESSHGEKVIWITCSYTDASIEQVCGQLREADAELATVVICNGTLHGEDYQPEKRIESVDLQQLVEVYQVNAVVPVLWLKWLLPLLEKSSSCTVAVMSARVGSISDNRLGGWYSYRASKAALNMLLKTAAIEYARRAKRVKLLAFHPGTTDTALSAPFQDNVPEDKLFPPDFVAERLLGIMGAQLEARVEARVEAQLEARRADSTLSFLDWDGKPIDW